MNDYFTPDTLTFPLKTYVDFVLDWAEAQEWASSEEAMFKMARVLKGHPELREAPPAEVHEALVAVADRKGIELDLPDGCLEDEDGLVAFCDAWERVRYPVGSDPVEAACGLLPESMIRTGRDRPGRYTRFLTIAALLQLQAAQRPILLPVHKVAEHFPCQAKTVCAWIRWATEDGVLVKTRQHVYRGPGEGRAAEYLLGLHLWRQGLPRIAKVLALQVRDEDLDWLAREFRRLKVRDPV